MKFMGRVTMSLMNAKTKGISNETVTNPHTASKTKAITPFISFIVCPCLFSLRFNRAIVSYCRLP